VVETGSQNLGSLAHRLEDQLRHQPAALARRQLERAG
jgi:hypothetical protein